MAVSVVDPNIDRTEATQAELARDPQLLGARQAEIAKGWAEAYVGSYDEDPTSPPPRSAEMALRNPVAYLNTSAIYGLSDELRERWANFQDACEQLVASLDSRANRGAGSSNPLERLQGLVDTSNIRQTRNVGFSSVSRQDRQRVADAMTLASELFAESLRETPQAVVESHDLFAGNVVGAQGLLQNYHDRLAGKARASQ